MLEHETKLKDMPPIRSLRLSARARRGFCILLALLAFLQFPACNSFDNNDNIKDTTKQVELPEFEISLFVPREWDISFSNGRFYPLIASGFGPNGLPATIEYRGLPTNPLDQASKALFAAGWYQAPPSNYTTWKYIRKGKIKGDTEGAYDFEGTFVRRETVYHRFGILRFRGKRVHGIFYTTVNTDVNAMRKFFQNIDALHTYSITEKKAETE